MLRNFRMKFFLNPKIEFLIFIVLFFIINLIQSYFTGLLDDEAYYWVWSQQLAVGYFDHPPLVALWIKISSLFFHGELGVRFFSILSFLGMLYFIWLSIDTPKKRQYVWLYFLLIVSVAFLNVYGFVALPDTPLLFFTALFLFAYKRFLETNSTAFALLLGIASAGMLYSKYHGALLLILIVISNFGLLKNKKFWLAVLVSVLLLIPYIIWQIEHHFMSVRYQLFERSKHLYKLRYTLNYFVDLLVIIGVSFPIIFWAFFKKKTSNQFEKSLQYIVIGFIVFFFFSTFKTSTQAQWNVIVLIPLVILTFDYFIEHTTARKWLVYLGLTNLFLMLIARFFLLSNSLLPVEFETHRAKNWAQNIKEKTQGKPIIFINSYQLASKYNFYTNIKTHSFSILKGRQSQYDLSNFEQEMQGKDVVVIGKEIEGKKFFKQKNKTYFGKYINNYRSLQKIKCIIDKKRLKVSPDEKAVLQFEIFNPYNFLVSFENVTFVGVFQGKKNAIIKEIPLVLDTHFSLQPNERKVMNASFKVPENIKQKGLTFRIGLAYYDLPVGFQGNKVITTINNE